MTAPASDAAKAATRIGRAIAALLAGVIALALIYAAGYAVAAFFDHLSPHNTATGFLAINLLLIGLHTAIIQPAIDAWKRPK